MSPLTLEQMLNHRLHIGHLSSTWNPRFAPFILTKKNERHIIDLRKTQQCLQEAVEKMKEIVQQGGKILFVGTKKQARAALIDAAQALEGAYMVDRWLGGTLTNFGTIYKSIKKMSKMDDLEDDIVYKNLTKKEQAIQQGKKLKLKSNLAGIKDLRRVPQAVFIVDIKKEATAVREATKMGIPIFAIVDTNTNPQLVDYPIPANDDAQDAIKLIMAHLTKEVQPALEAWQAGKASLTKAPVQAKSTTAPQKAKTSDKTAPSPKAKVQEKAKAAVAKGEGKVREQVNVTPPAEEASKAPAKAATQTRDTTKDAPMMDKKAKLAALKTLRQRTKAAVMACQEAWTEAKGDIDKAVDILYVHAQKKVTKLSQNETTQHFVFGGAHRDKKRGVLIQLSCQTDFVGNNEDFTRLAHEIVHVALDTQPAQGADLLQAKIQNKTVQELINFWIAAFGENIVLSDYVALEGEVVTCFVHPNKKTGSLVETNATKSSGETDAAEQVAMQVALQKPMGISSKEVIDTLQAGGKKIPNVEKIAASKALLTQPFFQNEEQTVEAYLKATDPDLTVKAFVRAPQSKAGGKK